MKLIVITHQMGNLHDGHTGGAEKLTGFIDSILDQKVLGAFLRGFFENFAEITAVQTQIGCHVFDGDLIHIETFDKIHSGLNIEILNIIFRQLSGVAGASDQGAEEQIGIAHDFGR